MITLLIARHGNTFDPGDTILRVGKKTDLSLSRSGQEQAKKLGFFLQEKYPKIDRVFVSTLQRTQQTAAIALPNCPFEINSIFDEIDYGIDDGKPESHVIARIGEKALRQWETQAIPPIGWTVEPEKIIQNWRDFAEYCIAHYPSDATILVVTSNGIARFASYLVENLDQLFKMSTGALSSFVYDGRNWQLVYWNKKFLYSMHEKYNRSWL